MPDPEPVGIDFGTSTCKMVRFVDGELRSVRIGGTAGTVLVPSVVRFPDNGGRITVGTDAAASQISKAHFTYPSAVTGHGPIKTSLTRAEPAFQPMVFEGQTYHAQDMAEEIFAYLVEGAQESLGYRPSQAVVTVPAYFTQAQNKLIHEAATNAGIYVIRTIGEPVAAAIADTFRSGGRFEGYMLVYDFGGGTFDTAVLKVNGGTFDVLAKLGNPELGGNKLGRDVYDRFFRGPGEQLTGFNLDLEADLPPQHEQGYDGTDKQALFQAAEQAKIRLSDQESWSGTVELWTKTGRQVTGEFTATRKDLEDTIRHHIAGTIETVDRVATQAGVRLADLDHVLLAGGVTRMPIIREALKEKVGAGKVRVPGDPDILVAEGAALVAGSSELSRVAVRDVLARSLRMRLPGRTDTRVIIASGTAVDDAGNTLTFKWPSPETTEAQIDLCEGEADDYAQNAPLGVVKVTKPNQTIPAGAKVEVTFRFDTAANAFAPSAEAKDKDGRVIRFGATLDAASRAAVGGAGLTAEAVAKADIVLCLDVSASFRRGPLPIVRDLCLRLEQTLRDAGIQYRFGLVAFGDSRVPGEQLKVSGFSGLPGALRGKLGELPSYDGGDAPEDVALALKAAADLMRSARPDADRSVWLFTDAPPKRAEEVRGALAALQSAQTRAYVFAPYQPYREEYGEVAEGTGGAYVDVHQSLHEGVKKAIVTLTAK